MPFTYLPGEQYLKVNAGRIELWLNGEMIISMTPEEARSNAADLIEAADSVDGKAG